MAIRSYGARNVVFLRRDSGTCRAFPAKPEEMVIGLGEDKTVMINLRQESKKPISLENLFEVVADDLQSMNDNLLSIVGAENPVLISAAEQIFCAGGKKMRALVNYFPSRYDPVRHAEKYPTPPAVCYGNRERCIIEKENNFKEPGDRYRSFTPERQERFIGRWIDALSDPPITHEIRSIWISYWSQPSECETRYLKRVNKILDWSLCGSNRQENKDGKRSYVP
ncbi:hypothetical protein Bca4012_090055 [Brassica carinata]